MVQITAGEFSEIFRTRLGEWVGGGDPVNKRMKEGGLNMAWCNVRSNVTKGVMILIRLQ